MRRLRLFILFFCLAVSFPMAYVCWQTYSSLAQEERAQLRYFSETVFDEMEKTMADLIRDEEHRSVEEYHYTLAQDGSATRPSPLSRMPDQPYILGYLQNNPDGSFQTPLVANLNQIPDKMQNVVDRMAKINQVFNQKKFDIPVSPVAVDTTPPMPGIGAEKEKSKIDLAERYISRSSKKDSKTYLGKKEIRTEEITVQQALNVAQDDQRRQVARQEAPPPFSNLNSEDVYSTGDRVATWGTDASDQVLAQDENEPIAAAMDQRFQVELAPFQSVSINTEQVFIFRRIAIRNQIYRQGFVLDVPAFFNFLADTQFKTQPLSDFMTLRMRILDQGHNTDVIQTAPSSGTPRFSAYRRFPAPFGLFSASLQADTIPRSPARRPLNIALIILGTVMLLGLLAIYQSTRTVVDMSERRSQFVSSVTHELKTPLTNIRMYVEMIEQGIAATPEREQEYLQVLDAESARLSRLINNVLELAKLEKKQRRFRYQEGELADVFTEVQLIMAQKLKQEGFTLTIKPDPVPPFAYDREVLIQLLVNLIENSIKFGRHSSERHLTITVGLHEDNDHIRIALSDTGPGIPKKALKKVFDDFYRVDNELTRTTGGTGIGLALVKKFVDAMGGQVHAVNNPGPGCTIILDLPKCPVP